MIADWSLSNKWYSERNVYNVFIRAETKKRAFWQDVLFTAAALSLSECNYNTIPTFRVRSTQPTVFFYIGKMRLSDNWIIRADWGTKWDFIRKCTAMNLQLPTFPFRPVFPWQSQDFYNLLKSTTNPLHCDLWLNYSIYRLIITLKAINYDRLAHIKRW